SDPRIELLGYGIVQVGITFERVEQLREIPRASGLFAFPCGQRVRERLCLVTGFRHAVGIAPRAVDGKEWLAALLGDELVEVRLRVREPDVVFVKGIVEASEGV